MLVEAIVDAENWLLDLGDSGITRPQVFSCSDGVDRVLKIEGLGATTGAMLLAEWVGALFATDLEVPTPRPSLVRISDEALATSPPEVYASSCTGLAFGSEYVKHAIQPAGLSTLVGATNHAELLSRLLVVDVWLGVEDRSAPDFGRNLLINNEGGARVLMAIDFGLSLSGALYPIFGAREIERPSTWKGLLHLLDETSVRNCLDDLEALTEAEIVKIVRTTPKEWADDERVGKVAAYLLFRQHRVRSVVAHELGW